MLERMRELSTESAVEIRKEDPEYSGPTPIDLSGVFRDPTDPQSYTWKPWHDDNGRPTTLGNLTLSAGAGLTYQSPYTVSVNNTTVPTWTSMPFNSITGGTTINGGRIELEDPDADIRINGVSLVDTLKTIQDRLNILQPNPEMEKEWDQLRELGAQYRALEIKLKEQADMWTRLQAMPPPEID